MVPWTEEDVRKISYVIGVLCEVQEAFELSDAQMHEAVARWQSETGGDVVLAARRFELPTVPPLPPQTIPGVWEWDRPVGEDRTDTAGVQIFDTGQVQTWEGGLGEMFAPTQEQRGQIAAVLLRRTVIDG